jgi:3-phenylpropionate/trans-cinnamate dioxygenase ferredoxin component
MRWVDAAAVALVRDRGMLEAEAGGTAVLLIALPAAIHAVAAVCPHQAAWLSMGRVSGEHIDCPRHQGRFRIADGALVRGPACPPLATYPVRVVGGRVLVGLDRAPPAAG